MKRLFWLSLVLLGLIGCGNSPDIVRPKVDQPCPADSSDVDHDDDDDDSEDDD
jgi:hypothetical protein